MSLTPLHYNRYGSHAHDAEMPMYGYSQYVTDCGRFVLSKCLTLIIDGVRTPPIWCVSLTSASIEGGTWLQWFKDHELIQWSFPTRRDLLNELTKTLEADGLLNEVIS